MTVGTQRNHRSDTASLQLAAGRGDDASPEDGERLQRPAAGGGLTSAHMSVPDHRSDARSYRWSGPKEGLDASATDPRLGQSLWRNLCRGRVMVEQCPAGAGGRGADAGAVVGEEETGGCLQLEQPATPASDCRRPRVTVDQNPATTSRGRTRYAGVSPQQPSGLEFEDARRRRDYRQRVPVVVNQLPATTHREARTRGPDISPHQAGTVLKLNHRWITSRRRRYRRCARGGRRGGTCVDSP